MLKFKYSEIYLILSIYLINFTTFKYENKIDKEIFRITKEIFESWQNLIQSIFCLVLQIKGISEWLLLNSSSFVM